MKYTVNKKILSFNFLGSILLVCSFIHLGLSFYKINISAIAIAVIFIILGYLIKRQSKHIIFRNKIFVIEKISNTLNLLKLEAEKNTNKFFIKKTKTNITVHSFFGLVILSFDFCDRNSKKEKFLADTLVKLQMQD